MKNTIAWVALLACLHGSAAAADRFGAARAYIETQMAEGNIPAVSVAVSQHGRILWEEGFGWADKERRIPATSETVYSLASISKPLTATGLMTLVQAGRIDLDKPINDYLGEAALTARAGRAEDATVRRVANHSSGLPLHYQFFFSDEPYVRPPMEETIRRYGNLIAAPGEKTEYSNLGYGVLDHLISRVSGMSYGNFMADRVFRPLGLSHMSVGVAPRLKRFEAVRYDEDGAPIPFYDSDHPGASAVYGSAHDLVRFGMFHLKDRLRDQKPILSGAAIGEMQRITSTIDEDSGFGIAWKIVDRDDGYRIVEHGGGMPGVGVVLVLVPAEDVAIAVLTNHRYGRHRDIADQVLKVVLPGWKPAQETERSERSARPEPPLPRDLHGRWTGHVHTHVADVPISLEFLPSGEVYAELEGRRRQVSRLRFHDGWLEGRLAEGLNTEEVSRRAPVNLSLTLKLRGPLLNGAAIARSDGMRGSALNHWVELKKQGGND